MDRGKHREKSEECVLRYLLRGETTRAELVRATGLSVSTIDGVTATLIEQGDIIQKGEAAQGRGRSEELLAFNNKNGAIIAVDIGGTKCHGVVADLSGRVIHQSSIASWSKRHDSPLHVLESVLREANEFAELNGLPVVVVTVGVPGVVDAAKGEVVDAPNLEWRNLELRLVLEALFHPGVRFVIENDVNLAAHAHHWIGQAIEEPNFIVVSIGTGVGAAIFADGELLRGRSGSAGEIGYYLPSRRFLHPDEPGGVGALESLIGGPGIVSRWMSALPTCDQKAADGSTQIQASDLIAAALGNDEIAQSILDETLDYLTLALVTSAVMLDPSKIVIEGGVGRSLLPYETELNQRIAQHIRNPPAIVVTEFDQHAPILGGIRAALLTLFGSNSAAVRPNAVILSARQSSTRFIPT